MAALHDLDELLSAMEPAIIDGEYVFVTTPVGDEGLAAAAFASVREPEGITYVVPRTAADDAGLSYDFVAGWIMLTVHSALAAVGLTAAVSAVLADEGISCNVIAGFHHDHLLVPADRVADAISALRTLAQQARYRRPAP
jgi:uncharacterized protein